MSSANQDPRQQYRATVEQLAQRVENDEAFARQAKADPVGTLTAAGIPADMVTQLMSGGGDPQTEVAGYARCTDTTCWSSICPSTCGFTTYW